MFFNPTSFRSLVSLCVVLLASRAVAASPAKAGGEIYVRDVTASNLPACDLGVTKEIFHTGGDIHGSYSSLVIACLQDDETASWVLISGTNCYPETMENGDGFCSSKKARVIPRMEVDPEFWDPTKQRAPFRMQYQLIKSGIGIHCREISQPTSDQYADYSAWLCDTVTLQDGTRDPTTYQEFAPQHFALKKIWTESQSALAPADDVDLANSIPSSFIFDKEAYVYNHR